MEDRGEKKIQAIGSRNRREAKGIRQQLKTRMKDESGRMKQRQGGTRKASTRGVSCVTCPFFSASHEDHFCQYVSPDGRFKGALHHQIYFDAQKIGQIVPKVNK